MWKFFSFSRIIMWFFSHLNFYKWEIYIMMIPRSLYALSVEPSFWIARLSAITAITAPFILSVDFSLSILMFPAGSVRTYTLSIIYRGGTFPPCAIFCSIYDRMERFVVLSSFYDVLGFGMDFPTYRVAIRPAIVIKKKSGCFRAFPEPYSITSYNARFGCACSSSNITPWTLSPCLV